MWPNLQETADLVTFTDEIFNGKLYILCGDWIYDTLDFDWFNQLTKQVQFL